MTAAAWVIRLSATAEADMRQILRWTMEHFGTAQAHLYAETLSSALQTLCAGPSVPGARARPDIEAHVRTLHVARSGRKGRHFILFRVADAGETRVIDVLRVLHDSMDPKRHLPVEPGGPKNET